MSITTMYLNNLAWGVTDDQLLSFINGLGHGNAEWATVARSDDGRSKGYALVHCKTKEAVDDIIAAVNGANLEGRKVFARLDRGQTVRDTQRAPRNDPAPGEEKKGRRPRRERNRDQAERQEIGEVKKEERGGRRGKRPDRRTETPASTTGAASSNVVYAGNLTYTVTEEGLRAAFATYSIARAELKYGNDGRPRGWALLHFVSPVNAALAIQEMNSVQLEGRPMNLREDRRKETAATL